MGKLLKIDLSAKDVKSDVTEAATKEFLNCRNVEIGILKTLLGAKYSSESGKDIEKVTACFDLNDQLKNIIDSDTMISNLTDTDIKLLKEGYEALPKKPEWWVNFGYFLKKIFKPDEMPGDNSKNLKAK